MLYFRHRLREEAPMKAFKSILVALMAVIAAPATSWAKTEVQFWHALQAVLG